MYGLSPPLLQLNALAANGLTAQVGAASRVVSGGLEVTVILIIFAILVLGRPPARRLGTSCKGSERVAAMRTGTEAGKGSEWLLLPWLSA